VDSVFDAYYDWHIRTGYMEFSAQIDALLGLSPQALPRAFAAWLDRLHPEDRAATVEAVEAAVGEGGVYRDEYRLRRNDGTYVHVRDRGVVLRDADGSSSHMIGAIRDVTGDLEAERALHEAAELYRTLFENSVNPTYQIGADGSFLDANHAGLRFLTTSRPRLLRRGVKDVWGDAATDAVREATASGDATTLELELQASGGGVKALALTLVPCRYRGATTSFALGTDITDHRTLRMALQESEESLRQQAAALSDSNTALRVILEQRNRDRAELERTITENVETMILPMLGRLAKPLATTPQAVYLDAAMQGLREVVSPLAQVGSSAEVDARLTPREREIARLIGVGRSTSEIAEALYISPSTVSFHRKNLRRKLGLAPRGPRLASYLGSRRD